MEYTGKDGKKHLSPLNLVQRRRLLSWSKSLASQISLKQSLDMAKRQLGITHKSMKTICKVLCSYEPVIKRKLLEV